MNIPVLIVGYGSIGKRHFENLRSLGYSNISLLRTREGLHNFNSPANVNVFYSMEEALSSNPKIVIIANPTSFHIKTTKEVLKIGAAVILEKPIDKSYQLAEDFINGYPLQNQLCTMAYCFRFHPLYKAMHEVIKNGSIGRVFHVHSIQASYLPKWHPYEDYRISYASKESLGGGVVRTLDHELDMIQWLFGMPESVIAKCAHLSNLEIDVEDTADMIFSYPNSLQVHVHVSFARHDYKRGMTVIGENGTAILDWNESVVYINKNNCKNIILKLQPDFDLNAIYKELIEASIASFLSAKPFPLIPLTEGLKALKMAEYAIKSSIVGTILKF